MDMLICIQHIYNGYTAICVYLVKKGSSGETTVLWAWLGVSTYRFQRVWFYKVSESNVRLTTLIQHLWLEVLALGNQAVKVQTCTEHRKAWTKTWTQNGGIGRFWLNISIDYGGLTIPSGEPCFLSTIWWRGKSDDQHWLSCMQGWNCIGLPKKTDEEPVGFARQ